MVRPERGEELVVRHDAWVEVELERFAVIAQVVIGRIDEIAASIADARADDSAVTPERASGVQNQPSAEVTVWVTGWAASSGNMRSVYTAVGLAFTWQLGVRRRQGT